jgi:serine/threonine-protein kinase
MLISYLSFYLIFVIIFSVLLSLIVLKFRIFSPHIIIPIIVTVLLLPGLIGYLYFVYFTSIPEVVVPDLKGKALEAAFEELEALGLEGEHAGNVFDMRLPEGHVVSQRPEGGRMVKAGRAVSLLTSSGKRKVLVPNLLGRPAVQAEAVLAAKGLTLGAIEENYVPELDSGIILTQSPLPGEEVNVGTFVSLTISTTKELVIITKVSSEEEEEERKEEGGFKLWWW